MDIIDCDQLSTLSGLQFSDCIWKVQSLHMTDILGHMTAGAMAVVVTKSAALGR